jgi:hypothetical protein
MVFVSTTTTAAAIATPLQYETYVADFFLPPPPIFFLNLIVWLFHFNA